MGKCRTKLDGLRPSFLSQDSLQILIPETSVSQNVLLDINPNTGMRPGFHKKRQERGQCQWNRGRYNWYVYTSPFILP
jgi:hypothetical protein